MEEISISVLMIQTQTKEKEEYVNSIKEDVEWLGADYHEHIYYASNYFDKMYECAEFLIKKGKAYVCDLNAEQIREYRGTLTEPGKNSPYRDRTPEENLQLFREMKEGKYPDGSKVLRAKIDMTSGNINMRIQFFIVSQEWNIIIQETNGVSIQCMTLHIH